MVFGHTLSLSSSLVHISGSIIKNSEHWDNSVRSPISSPDVTACGPDVVNRETNSTGAFTNDSTFLQSIINPFNAVFFHANQETTTQLKGSKCKASVNCHKTLTKDKKKTKHEIEDSLGALVFPR